MVVGPQTGSEAEVVDVPLWAVCGVHPLWVLSHVSQAHVIGTGVCSVLRVELLRMWLLLLLILLLL